MTDCSFEGGVKFFEESVALYRDGATATATSNNDNAKEILTNDRRTIWESEGSDDTTTETIEIEFPAEETINRIYLGDVNFKDYNIKYDDSGTWTDIVLEQAIDGAFENTENLTDNTFEYDLTYWSIISGTYAISTDTPLASIAKSIRWQNAVNYGALRQITPKFTTTTGQVYKVTLWLKGDAGADMQIYMRNGDDSGDIIFPTGNFQISASWEKYEFFYEETAGGDGAYFSLVAREAAGITDVYMTLPSVKEYEEIDTIYYEFDDITTDKLQINCTTTQTADEEKRIASALAMTEIGQFNLFPDVVGVAVDRNEDNKKTLNDKSLIQKGFKTRKFNLRLPKYIDQDDVDLMSLLFDKEENFYVWLAAGKYGTDYFKPAFEPFRLEDLITMQTISNVSNTYSNNLYKDGGLNTTLKLTEVVG